jgi:hypothetical protein
MIILNSSLLSWDFLGSWRWCNATEALSTDHRDVFLVIINRFRSHLRRSQQLFATVKITVYTLHILSNDFRRYFSILKLADIDYHRVRYPVLILPALVQRSTFNQRLMLVRCLALFCSGKS